MPRGICPICKKGEIIYKIGSGKNEGQCSRCPAVVAYTWLLEQLVGVRPNPELTPDFK